MGVGRSLAQSVSVEEVLMRAYEANHELAASKANVEKEQALISSSRSLQNPRFGLMQESGMNASQNGMGPMELWSVSQEVMFPTKYFSLGRQQEFKAEAAEEEYRYKRLEIRQRALTSYFHVYALSRISALFRVQKETLREISRIAETRRATGAVPQQDEMKAHVELTKIENEILLTEQELVEAQAELAALLDQDIHSQVKFDAEDLRLPKLKYSPETVSRRALDQSRMISAERNRLAESEERLRFSRLSYLPDFMLTFRKPLGEFSQGYAMGIDLSIPLWFFSKQNSEVNGAHFESQRARRELQKVQRQVEAEAASLGQRVQTLLRLLQIYDKALIPQSNSALNSSRAAYRAGRVGFQDLLDAERLLYSIRVEYYRHVEKFVETLTKLELMVGEGLSDLPFDEN